MTAIIETPARLRGAQLLAMDPEQLQQLIDRDFDTLVSLAIADATHRHAPESVRALLRADGMWEGWQDALACAEATLQVAVERLDYECDERLGRVQRQLRAVRWQFHVAAQAANRRRKHVNTQAAGQRPEWLLSPRAITLRWLKWVHRGEYIARVEALYAAAGLGEPVRSPDTRYGMFEQAIAEGWIAPPDGEQAARLLALPDAVFRQAVVEDARDQNERIAGLFHPHVTERWLEALAALMRDMVPVACASSEHVLGPLTVDLLELGDDDAYRLLNARRFFTGLRQRRIECKRWARIWTSDVMQAEKRDPRVVAYRLAQKQAREALAEAYPEDFARIHAVLTPAGGPRPLGPELTEHTYPVARKRMLAELFPEWAAAEAAYENATTYTSPEGDDA